MIGSLERTFSVAFPVARRGDGRPRRFGLRLIRRRGGGDYGVSREASAVRDGPTMRPELTWNGTVPGLGSTSDGSKVGLGGG